MRFVDISDNRTRFILLVLSTDWIHLPLFSSPTNIRRTLIGLTPSPSIPCALSRCLSVLETEETRIQSLSTRPSRHGRWYDALCNKHESNVCELKICRVNRLFVEVQGSPSSESLTKDLLGMTLEIVHYGSYPSLSLDSE